MTDKPISLAEALAIVDGYQNGAILPEDVWTQALTVLVAHARATDTALVASLAEEAHQIARDLSGPGIVSRAKADVIAERAAALAVALSINPARPLAVGDMVTEEDIHRLPVDSVLRDATGDIAWLDHENTWRIAGLDGMGGTALVDFPARVLDLPEATS